MNLIWPVSHIQLLHEELEYRAQIVQIQRPAHDMRGKKICILWPQINNLFPILTNMSARLTNSFRPCFK